MSDVAFENFAHTTRYSTMIRKSVHEVVEGVLAKVPGNTNARQDIRAAGERLGTALVAHAERGRQPRSALAAPEARVDANVLPTVGDSDERARAFRVMAGVRR